MRIYQLTPGSGEFYCENCIRDAALARALGQAGHDGLLVPLYLPLRVDVELGSLSADEIFMGGINVYLQQRWGLFRRLPAWADRILNRPGMLARLTARSAMIEPAQLGELTLSMLQGRQGRQAKEIRRLVRFLRREIETGGVQDTVICLSNALLLGLAGPLAELGVPVVCLLQDEDTWLDGLPPEYQETCWREMARQAAHVGLFIAPSHYYRDFMTTRLRLPAERIRVIYNSLDSGVIAIQGGEGVLSSDIRAGLPVGAVRVQEDHGQDAHGTHGRDAHATGDHTPTIGFLSRTCPQKGLDLLVEALAVVRRSEGLARTRLLIAGGHTDEDAPFLQQLAARIRELGLAADVEFVTGLSREDKAAFIRRCDVLAVPARRPEASGLFILESLCAGVPVVLPRHGAYVELIEMLGGGVLHTPGDVVDIARVLAGLLQDSDRARQLGQAGRAAVREKLDATQQARLFAEAMESLGKRRSDPAGHRNQRGSGMLLELKDVRKSFTAPNGSSIDVLRGLDLAIQAGESLAIVGPSGSGKSTLLNIIGTLDRPSDGRVLLDGMDVTALGERALAALRARRIGFVFQMHHLLPQCTALENVLVPTLAAGDTDARARARRLLERVGLGDRMDHRPAQLSLGQCQRVAVARALINEPSLLLADEPTGSLDYDSRQSLTDLLLELHRDGLAMIVATHSTELAARLGHTLRLQAGRLVDGAEPAEARQ